jgi:MarR family transcriptional regulator, lower aerobic nicotinate degradation pathway regulator
MLTSNQQLAESSRRDRVRQLKPTAGYLIRRCRQLGLALYAEEAGDLLVTTQQYTILRVLAQQPEVEQTALCEVTALDRSTTAVLLDKLEKRGWARRSPSPQNRRRNLISITREGRAQLRRTDPVIARAERRFLAPLSETERRSFLGLLQRLIDAHETALAGRTRGRRR